MIERRPGLTVLAHAVMIGGVALVAFPVYVALLAASHTQQDVVQAPMPLIPGGELLNNLATSLFQGTRLVQAGGDQPMTLLLFNSLVTSLGIAVGKIAVSLLSAFAIVYFRFPFRTLFFWMIFVTLMLPVEVRIIPTYKVVADFGLLDTYAGLILPLVASATATFLFRQFFLTIPDELVEAARIDGAGPMRFFFDVLLPLSRTNIAAMFVILFIYGWNQYLWPLLITTRGEMKTAVVAIGQMMLSPESQLEWPLIMTVTLLGMLPPVLVVVLMQRWFVKGLVESEK